ncbi:Glucan endo-1,3-beta-glucosidase 1 [Morella rubra]|uniref:Glucan endo-1,3-beta-glucosidase 1 n=1 Tax=Morella rubra TaxID=262757 RepID=A0A6A1UXV8_9ROSI|nr:Glucan endo-1,3-beta-glucosidase 1 [Morella rubra]
MSKFLDSKPPRSSIGGFLKKLKARSRLEIDPPLDSSDAALYGVGTPSSLPPFDSLAPGPLPDNTPPFCVNPPLTPLPPSRTIPSPMSYALPPPSPGSKPNFPVQSPPSIPDYMPSPPSYSPVPYPPEYEPSPPRSFPSPPNHGPSTPKNVPSPPKHLRSPPIYLPPLVFPPPSVPPPPHKKSQFPVWCVVKPTVPDPIIQAAMDYACGSGADCTSIQRNGSCYQPDTLSHHASYAFNSYWQNTKLGGGTCDFGGTAMLVTVDPRTGQKIIRVLAA